MLTFNVHIFSNRPLPARIELILPPSLKISNASYREARVFPTCTRFEMELLVLLSGCTLAEELVEEKTNAARFEYLMRFERRASVSRGVTCKLLINAFGNGNRWMGDNRRFKKRLRKFYSAGLRRSRHWRTLRRATRGLVP